MKKVVLFVSMFLFAVGCVAAQESFVKGSKKASDRPVKAAETQAPDAKREAMKKLLQEKKQELNGSEWEVEVTTDGKSLGKDTLTFQNNQITCKTLTDRSYPATNYTVSVPEGSDMSVWETMQTNPKGGVVFIRGEWKEGLMRGVMSEQQEGGPSKDFNFASVGKIAVPPTTEKKEEPKPEPPVESAPLVADVTVAEPPPAEVQSEDVAPFSPGTTDEIKSQAEKAAKSDPSWAAASVNSKKE